MKNTARYLVFSLCLILSHNAIAKSSAPALEKWLMNMIYQPAEPVLERESKGFVFIYHGFNETQVDQILADRFGRIDNLMFTRIKLTDNSGNILLDAETSDELTADNGWD